MQDLVDSLCQCFGANVPPPESFRAGSQMGQHQNASASDEVKRRTSSLRERQWDTIFPSESVSRHHSVDMTPIKQANVIVKTKQAATSKLSNRRRQNSQKSRPISLTHKRKRSSGSRDDIFRSKYRSDSGNANCIHGNPNSHGNPLSRFLSNHPVIMNSLCFATPIKDSSSDENAFTSRCGDGAPIDAQSVISVCDDEDDNTMTSTVYYETTKLAGLRQTSPPMPLFNHFAVDERDDIHRIVATHSHSSARLIDLFRSCHQQSGLESKCSGPDTNHVLKNERQHLDEDLIPPQMTNSSSSSSKSSNGYNR